MITKEYKPLKLSAVDKEDLQVLSTCIQDSLVPIASMNYEEDKGQFYLMLNRFCWECHPEATEAGDVHQRVQSGLHIDHVKGVKQKGFDPNHEDGFMNLLTIHNERNGCVTLVFSGGGEVELDVEKLKCLIKDLTAPYPTKHKPQHPVADK